MVKEGCNVGSVGLVRLPERMASLDFKAPFVTKHFGSLAIP